MNRTVPCENINRHEPALPTAAEFAEVVGQGIFRSHRPKGWKRVVTPALGFTTLGEAALAYASMNWPAFPLSKGKKTPLIAKAAGGRGVYDATVDSATIRRWWSGHP